MKTKILSLALLLCALSFNGCNDAPNVKTAYDFSLSSWHLKESAKPDEEVEIRFYLSREGNFRDASYRFGYVQLDGEGRIYNNSRRIYTDREEYNLSEVPGLDTSDPNKWVYTLFYRHSTDKKSDLQFFVIDNLGNRREYEIEFDTDTSSKDNDTEENTEDDDTDENPSGGNNDTETDTDDNDTGGRQRPSTGVNERSSIRIYGTGGRSSRDRGTGKRSSTGDSGTSGQRSTI
jgi:hypothetical protein